MSKAHDGEVGGRFRKFLWNNGLSLVVLGLFLGTWVGQSLTGWFSYNNDQNEHGQATVGYVEYLRSGHFWEATGENWESEFLQMGMFVMLTIWLRQKGSAESKKTDEEEAVDRDPKRSRDNPDVPWPVRRGGAALWVYSNSLSVGFILLFLASFLIHAAGGAKEYSSQQQAHGELSVSMIQFMGTSQFWHESLQNWQSEFLSIAAMVILTIWLRQHGSPESKPVDAPHSQTGGD